MLKLTLLAALTLPPGTVIETDDGSRWQTGTSTLILCDQGAAIHLWERDQYPYDYGINHAEEGRTIIRGTTFGHEDTRPISSIELDCRN